MKRFSMTLKFGVLLVGILVGFTCLNLAWETKATKAQTEAELLEQARALSANMDAVWHFMTINQDLINYDSKGNFEFKGLQCSIAGRSIGSIFSQSTDYRISYVSETPRNDHDYPQPYELAVLAQFDEPDSDDEHYEVVQGDGGETFRYMSAMRITDECLGCHGEPAGEIDPSGYAKEGMKVGDLYGALSMEIPMDSYVAAAESNKGASVAFSALLAVLIVMLLAVALRVLVAKPVRKIDAAMESFEGGDFEVRLKEEGSTREMRMLAEGFNDMADKIQNAYATLEEKVVERTDELEDANKVLENQQRELERANAQLASENQYKGEFLAMMSHELKTPLAASMSFAGVLRDHAERAAALDASDARMWDELEQNHQALLAMIDNILQMARIEAGREELRLQAVDVGDLVGSLMATIDPVARQKSVSISYDVADDVLLFMADPDKMNRILQNLASNAVKFTDSGGSIIIGVAYNASSSELVFSVSDTGIGISDEDQQVIFDRFVQVDSSASRSYGGSGLGLATARELARMHGGDCSVKSDLGVGSTFTVTIPFVEVKGISE